MHREPFAHKYTLLFSQLHSLMRSNFVFYPLVSGYEKLLSTLNEHVLNYQVHAYPFYDTNSMSGFQIIFQTFLFDISNMKYNLYVSNNVS